MNFGLRKGNWESAKNLLYVLPVELTSADALETKSTSPFELSAS